MMPATDITASGTSTPLVQSGMLDLVVMLNCSAVPTGGAPTLDVYLQFSVDQGTTWQDQAHYQFTTSTAKKFWQIAGRSTGATASIAASNAALSGDTVRQGPFGDRVRLSYVFAAVGSSGPYTLSASSVAKC